MEIENRAKPSTWSAVDGLGRTLSDYNEVGGPRPDKYVAIFYWPCHGYWPKYCFARNISERWSQADEETKKEARNDFNHPMWQTKEGDDSWYWDESIFGYYDTQDSYVIRKHAEMLADAGVDLILFDTCVGLKTTASYHDIFKGFEDAMKDGVSSPKVSFILPMGNPEKCRKYLMQLYEEIYSKEKYKEVWFYFEDHNGLEKPLIFAWNDDLNEDIPIEKEIKEFFSYRRPDPYSWRYGDEWDRILVDEVDDCIRNNNSPDYVGPKDKIEWGWLNTYPQTKYYYKDGDKLILDNMPVGVAQNVDTKKYTSTAMNGFNPAGRSYVAGDYKYSYETEGKRVLVCPEMDNHFLYGLNFQQQWDYAIKADPRFVFVTGWNEWTVGRYETFSFVCDGGDVVSNAFVDQFDYEYSRDTEPTKGILKDHYYYQLVENIRRFKGVEKQELKKVKKTIDLFGPIEQWDEIESFWHYKRSTKKRSHAGCRGLFYENDTMRNDIVRAKIAYDDEMIYFYVETLEDLTPHTDKAWMRLLISTDLTRKIKNWEGFNYIVNRIGPKERVCFLERAKGHNNEWSWEKIGDLDYSVNGRILQIAIRRDLLDLDNSIFYFKWSDNMQEEGQIMDFYQFGDVAPGARFMFTFDFR